MKIVKMEDTAKVEAYKIVLEDLLDKNIGVLRGKYDAVNGNEQFMYGVSTVMEMIAYSVNEKTGDSFSEMFFKNMEKSEKNT